MRLPTTAEQAAIDAWAHNIFVTKAPPLSEIEVSPVPTTSGVTITRRVGNAYYWGHCDSDNTWTFGRRE